MYVICAKRFETSDFLKMVHNIVAAMTDFTDEEGYGRYLDMHECYEKYINLKGVDVSVQ